MVDSDDGDIWVELKWAKSYGILFNCPWDAAKWPAFPAEIVDPVQILPIGFVRGCADDWEIKVPRVVAPGQATISLSDLEAEG